MILEKLIQEKKIKKGMVSDAHHIYGVIRLINRDFKKIEKAIQNFINGKSYKITKEQLIAFQNFELKKNILLEEPDQAGDVHAELQILSKLIRTNLNKQTYIGISKLCCFNCNHMISTANSILKEENSNLNIIVRGAHNASFNKNWSPPEIFKKGYAHYSSRTLKKHAGVDINAQNINFKIGYFSAKLFSELEPTSGKYRMDASLSSSEPSLEADLMLADHVKKIENALETLKTYNVPGDIEMLSATLKLSQLEGYKDLFEFKGDFIDNEESLLLKFFKILDESQEFIKDPKILFFLLTDPKFSNSHVRNYFKNLDLIEGAIKYKPKGTIIEESKVSILEEGNPLLPQFKMGQEKILNKSLQQEENIEMEDVEINYAIELSKEDLSKKNEFK